jgi:hypothetical protein
VHKELPERHASVGASGDPHGEGQVLAHVVVEREQAPLVELHQRRGGDGLRHRRPGERRLRGDRSATVGVCEAGDDRGGERLVCDERRGEPGHAELLPLALQVQRHEYLGQLSSNMRVPAMRRRPGRRLSTDCVRSLARRDHASTISAR